MDTLFRTGIEIVKKYKTQIAYLSSFLVFLLILLLLDWGEWGKVFDASKSIIYRIDVLVQFPIPFLFLLFISLSLLGSLRARHIWLGFLLYFLYFHSFLYCFHNRDTLINLTIAVLSLVSLLSGLVIVNRERIIYDFSGRCFTIGLSLFFIGTALYIACTGVFYLWNLGIELYEMHWEQINSIWLFIRYYIHYSIEIANIKDMSFSFAILLLFILFTTIMFLRKRKIGHILAPLLTTALAISLPHRMYMLFLRNPFLGLPMSSNTRNIVFISYYVVALLFSIVCICKIKKEKSEKGG